MGRVGFLSEPGQLPAVGPLFWDLAVTPPPSLGPYFGFKKPGIESILVRQWKWVAEATLYQVGSALSHSSLVRMVLPIYVPETVYLLSCLI